MHGVGANACIMPNLLTLVLAISAVNSARSCSSPWPLRLGLVP